METVPAKNDNLDRLQPQQLLSEIQQLRDQYLREVPGKRKLWPESIRNRIVALYRLGVPGVHISRATGISKATIFKWYQDAGIQRRPKRSSGRFLAVTSGSSQETRERDNNGLVLRQDFHGFSLRLTDGAEFIGLRSVADAVALYRELKE